MDKRQVEILFNVFSAGVEFGGEIIEEFTHRNVPDEEIKERMKVKFESIIGSHILEGL